MRYFKSFGLKLLVTTITLLSTFSVFYDADISKIFITISILTVVSFIIGDILILRKVSNTVATVLDLPFHLLLLWITGELLLAETTYEILSVSVFAAVLITSLEPFVHHMLEQSEKDFVTTLNNARFQTEISKELQERDEDK
ncbi:Protein of unknown function [Gracilibacillus ureilyticus]|uniref:Integral membrane protein n=1 Tax=Gracilibacillus ureilyticus TaxID=531814 RepID=A0A1H9NG36_9BACI|nr:DUF2512 family protein [Gracilibacillus ureilyticus]SER34363.1 Protein of unknown function [Gracilibacillus ureilyticus]